MNIIETDSPSIIAKISGSKEQNNIKVIYSFIEGSHNLFIDKKDIIIAQFKACEILLRETANKIEKQIVQRELYELNNIIYTKNIFFNLYCNYYTI
jgi:hypothetical protein